VTGEAPEEKDITQAHVITIEMESVATSSTLRSPDQAANGSLIVRSASPE